MRVVIPGAAHLRNRLSSALSRGPPPRHSHPIRNKEGLPSGLPARSNERPRYPIGSSHPLIPAVTLLDLTANGEMSGLGAERCGGQVVGQILTCIKLSE